MNSELFKTQLFLHIMQCAITTSISIVFYIRNPHSCFALLKMLSHYVCNFVLAFNKCIHVLHCSKCFYFYRFSCVAHDTLCHRFVLHMFNVPPTMLVFHTKSPMVGWLFFIQLSTTAREVCFIQLSTFTLCTHVLCCANAITSLSCWGLP